MDKVNSILSNNRFNEYLMKNQEREIDRRFCCHDLQHFIDVARIAYIMVLENKINIDKEIVYGAALLHDIGRWMQYQDGTPHEIASYKLADDILNECNYKQEEKTIILNAILNHRNEKNEKGTFNYIFYLSDKLSRRCFSCTALDECKWPKEKKNLKILY
ncbi:HD domain-containing protein [Clostridium sp. OS1-26]|uniref:HD domain-containing protein n=1 Tax=Clostridium sp. OS1-26 TaxID=3070681 RepID=UPI0027E07135|nr:HD domain-containing protein [Clostridium sp. OS1-26]WML36858.1 HD domain-containing protein [Clostridium sp. OS1-26]